MYADKDYVSGLIAEAEEFCVANDRMLYAPFLRAAEEWCSIHECAVGNQHFYLLDKPNKDSFVIDIYAAYALTAARELADSLFHIHAPHIDTRTITVRTVLKNAEFHLKVNERVIVRIYGAPAYKKINMVALMGPVPRKGLFSAQSIPCIPPEIHLANMYRVLYSPSRFGEWELTFAALDKFWEGITETALAEKTRAVVGGAAENNRDWKGMYAAIEAVCEGVETPVVIGDIAIKRLTGAGDNKRLQIICAADIDKITAALAPLFGRKIVSVRYPLGLPMDFQTSKYTIYAGEKVPLCDVFNSSAFEIIPHEISGGIKFAAPFVLLRFKLIDYWLHRTIAKLTAGVSVVGIAHSVMRLREWTLKRTPAELFEGWKYIGYSINPAVAKNKLAAELSETPYPNYYPAKKAEATKDAHHDDQPSDKKE